MNRQFFRKILPPISRGTRATKKWACSENGPSFQPREKTPFMSAGRNSSTAKHLLDLISQKNPKDKEKITELLDTLWKRSISGVVLVGVDYKAIEAAQKFLRELPAA
jgi:hypothetical protein